MLGWLDTVEAKCSSAHRHLHQADATFTRGHMIEWLARVHLTRAACHLSEHNLDSALAACERALDLAAPRNYRLWHADGLVLLARIALARGDATSAATTPRAPYKSRTPANTPGPSATPCEVLAEAWRKLGNPAEAARYGERAANLNRRLTPAYDKLK